MTEFFLVALLTVVFSLIVYLHFWLFNHMINSGSEFYPIATKETLPTRWEEDE